MLALVSIPLFVRKTLLLREPLPCNPSAETALQPPIRSKSSPHTSSSPEESFFSRRRHQGQDYNNNNDNNNSNKSH